MSMKKLIPNSNPDFKFGLESLYMFVKDGVSRTTYIDLQNKSRDSSVTYLKNYLEELYNVAEASGKEMIIGDTAYGCTIDYFINIAMNDKVDFCVIKLDGLGENTTMEVEFFGEPPIKGFDYPEWLSITDDSNFSFLEDDLDDDDDDDDEGEEDPHDVEMQRLMDKYDKLGFPAFYISTNVSLYKLD